MHSSTPQPVNYPGILHATLFALIPNPSFYFHWKLWFHISGNHLKQIKCELDYITKLRILQCLFEKRPRLLYCFHYLFSRRPLLEPAKKKHSSKNMVCMRVNESTLNTLVTYQLKFFSPRSLPLARLSLCPATWVELKKKETTKAKQSDLETLPLKQTKQTSKLTIKKQQQNIVSFKLSNCLSKMKVDQNQLFSNTIRWGYLTYVLTITPRARMGSEWNSPWGRRQNKFS